MTSNERKILECIWDHGGKAHIQHITHRTKFSSGYSLFLCRSLAKAGHLEFINPNVCKLAKKGYGHFQDRADIEVVAVSSLPQEESADDPALSSIPSDDKDDESKEDENIETANDNQHDEEETEKPIAYPTDNIGLMIKRFIGLLKGSIKPSTSGHVAQGTIKDQ